MWVWLGLGAYLVFFLVVTIGRILGNSVREVNKWERRGR
jgi:hypothetical protein